MIEYTGSAIRALDMEGRMTVCNMSIEAGARAGLIAPDETTFAWLLARTHAPSGAHLSDPRDRARLEQALRYMRLTAGQRIAGQRVDVVFVGSCTNSRLGDLRAAARILAGRRIAPHVRMLVVPGSQAVKRQAEAEGLHEVFQDAGAKWRESGCSMCIAMNGDELRPAQVAVSTSNRNFEGRQGKGGRTFLASPMTAAASAVCGVITDARTFS